MDSNLSEFPILSYVLSTSQPTANPHLSPETFQNLFKQFPGLADPAIVAALSQSLPPPVAQCFFLLRSLGPRPDSAAVAAARSKISDPESPDQAKLFEALIRLEDMHAQYEKQLSDVEEMLRRVYGSVTGDLVLADPEVNEEVMRILKDAQTKVVERIDLSERQLRILPEVFGKLYGLVSLNLSHNDLEIIPDSIAGLKQLEEFDVSANQLTYLPDSIGLLSNLKVLNVSGNKLKALPESIAGCSSLVELDASYNSLACLPTNIGYGLNSLRKLSIQLNKIRSLPASVCEMRSLTHLDVHFNELRGLPPAIGRLTNLEVLNLGSNFNDLTEVPETVSDLVNLQELDLSNNQIKTLPDTFYRLDNLTKLNLEGNPLVVPPMEIVIQGAGAVKEFMAQRWLRMVEDEQKRIEQNSQQGQGGWLGRGTSLIGNLVSGVSQSVRGYLGSSNVSTDPYLDQQR